MRSQAGYIGVEDVLIPGLIVLLIALVILMGVASFHEHKRWEAFKVAHACKVVGQMDGELVTGIGSSGGGNAVMTVGSTSDKLGWLCDDGVTYWKNK